MNIFTFSVFLVFISFFNDIYIYINYNIQNLLGLERKQLAYLILLLVSYFFIDIPVRKECSP